jgi:hypothetical protein
MFKLEAEEKFDIVASYGLIKYFDDPMPVVKKNM